MITIQANNGQYYDFEVETREVVDHGTDYAPASTEKIVTACYYKGCEVWELLPNYMQSEIERAVN